MKLRTIGMATVAVLALVAGRAQAQDAGWDTKYGILFTIPNLLQNNDVDVVNNYDGKVGAQYNLTPRNALRLAANITRRSAGIEDVDTNGTKSKVVPDETSGYDLNLSGQYMLRFTPAAVSPYAGAGAFLDFTQSSRKGDGESTAGVVTTYDDTTRGFGFGVMATAGLEWRIHKVISLFAEYEADLTLIATDSTSYSTKVGAAAATTSDSSSKSFLGLTTGIGQGGKLGLIAFF